ncbi:hypothetical protein AB0D13_19650 [Streptomyces sp. NPDC048430]|uniref:hypothetical protein n=1 Tax=unclassified Streptomyces TaxID=2593676 RepID=UPI003431B6E9
MEISGRLLAGRPPALRNPPLHCTARNQLWLEIISLALDRSAWMPMLALTGVSLRWDPKKLRATVLRRRPAHHGRPATWLRFNNRWPWSGVITTVTNRLHALLNRQFLYVVAVNVAVRRRN